MSAKMTPINSEVHKNIKIKSSQNFEHAKNQHMASISANEFAGAAVDYPIVFVKNPETGHFKSVVVLGLNTGENLFYNDEKWLADYIPNSVQQHPFGLAGESIESEKLAICINTNSARVNSEDGLALYNDDGTESDYLLHIKSLMARMISDEKITQSFVQKLTDLDLLAAYTLTIKDSKTGEKKDINGLYSINEEKFRNLNSEQVFSLHSNGSLGAIYAHFISLARFNQLLKLQANQ
jgi:hypothetical protein